MNAGIVSQGASPIGMPLPLLGRPTPVPMPYASPFGRFLPSQISGLMGWWDFTDAKTLGRTATGLGGTSAGSAVRLVQDKSGANRHMVQRGTDADSPTLASDTLNGLSVLAFGGGGYLEAYPYAPVFLAGQTTFSVLRMTSTCGTYGRPFSQSVPGSSDFSLTGHYIPFIRNAGANSLSSYAASGHRSVVSVTLDQWCIACSHHTGSQIRNSINNGAAATFSNTLSRAFSQFQIGYTVNYADGAPGFWKDRIAETVVYAKSLSDSERLAVYRYLADKYAITIS